MKFWSVLAFGVSIGCVVGSTSYEGALVQVLRMAEDSIPHDALDVRLLEVVG